MLGIFGGNGPRLFGVCREELQIGVAIVVLKLSCNVVLIHAIERVDCLLDAILQQQVVSCRKQLRVVQFAAVCQHFEEPVVLPMQSIVDDLPAFTQRMSSGIYQRLVFQVLVGMPLDGVNGNQGALQWATAFVRQYCSRV